MRLVRQRQVPNGAPCCPQSSGTCPLCSRKFNDDAQRFPNDTGAKLKCSNAAAAVAAAAATAAAAAAVAATAAATAAAAATSAAAAVAAATVAVRAARWLRKKIEFLEILTISQSCRNFLGFLRSEGILKDNLFLGAWRRSCPGCWPRSLSRSWPRPWPGPQPGS